MTKEQYNEWRNHPATLFYRQFLKDRKEALIHEATEAWLNGSEAFEKERHEMRGAITELIRVEDIAFEVIENFYKEKHAAEDSERQES
jgi:hypothetical protein